MKTFFVIPRNDNESIQNDQLSGFVVILKISHTKVCYYFSIKIVLAKLNKTNWLSKQKKNEVIDHSYRAKEIDGWE